MEALLKQGDLVAKSRLELFSRLGIVLLGLAVSLLTIVKLPVQAINLILQHLSLLCELEPVSLVLVL